MVEARVHIGMGATSIPFQAPATSHIASVTVLTALASENPSSPGLPTSPGSTLASSIKSSMTSTELLTVHPRSVTMWDGTRKVHCQSLGSSQGGHGLVTAAAAVTLLDDVGSTQLAIATGGELTMWDQLGQVVWRITGNKEYEEIPLMQTRADIRALGFSNSPLKPRLFAGDSAGYLIALDYSKKPPVRMHSVQTSASVQMIHISTHRPKIIRIVAGSVDGCCGVYDDDLTHLCEFLPPSISNSFFQLSPLKLPADPVSAACFSTEGSYLCTAHQSGFIYLWSASSLFRSSSTIIKGVAKWGIEIDSSTVDNKNLDKPIKFEANTHAASLSLPNMVSTPETTHTFQLHTKQDRTEIKAFRDEIERQLAVNNSGHEDGDGSSNSVSVPQNRQPGRQSRNKTSATGVFMTTRAASAAANTHPRIIGTGKHGEDCTDVAFVDCILISAGSSGIVYLYSTKMVHRGDPKLRPLCSVQLPSPILGIVAIPIMDVEDSSPGAARFHVFCGCASRIARLDGSIETLTEYEKQSLSYQSKSSTIRKVLEKTSTLKIISEHSPSALSINRGKGPHSKPMKGTPSAMRFHSRDNSLIGSALEFPDLISTTSALPASPGGRAKGGYEWTSRVSSNGKPKPKPPKASDHAFRQRESSPRRDKFSKPIKQTVEVTGSIQLKSKPLTSGQESKQRIAERKLRQRQMQEQIKHTQGGKDMNSSEKQDKHTKHYQMPIQRPRVRFGTPEEIWLERENGKYVTPFSPEKLANT